MVGCMIDLDSQEISYSQNGENLGLAFEKFREKGKFQGNFAEMVDEKGNSLPYMPGISVGKNQVIQVNFVGDFK